MTDRSVEPLREIRNELQATLRHALAVLARLEDTGPGAREERAHLTAVLADLRRALNETEEALSELSR